MRESDLVAGGDGQRASDSELGQEYEVASSALP
eukprot:COSAG05_NODE_23_length_31591_cov_92.542995_15_plen_33_part_00